MMDQDISTFIQQCLDVSARRQQVLAANVANADTPGYRSQDVRFGEQIEMLRLSGSSKRHIDPIGASGGIHLVDTPGDAKPNGNNVNLDRELTEMTKNGIEFVLLIQVLQSKIRTLRSSLTEV